MPLSAEAQRAVLADPAGLESCLTGGDDYELLLAVPEAKVEALQYEAASRQVAVARIGRFSDGDPAVLVLDPSGRRLAFAHGGWSHF